MRDYATAKFLNFRVSQLAPKRLQGGKRPFLVHPH
jgi:hypothetical protein